MAGHTLNLYQEHLSPDRHPYPAHPVTFFIILSPSQTNAGVLLSGKFELETLRSRITGDAEGRGKGWISKVEDV